MKKLYFAYLLMVLAFVACDFAMPRVLSADASDSIFIRRYDRIESRYLSTGDFAALQEMNTQYPTETRALIEDILRLGVVSDPNINAELLNYFRDTTLQIVLRDVQAEFADISDLEKDLRKAFMKIRKELPQAEIPEFYTQVASFDQSIVVDNNKIGISLDKYLGKDYPLYSRFYDKHQRETMSREYIVSDCVVFYLISRYGLKDFDSRTQLEKDARIAIISWIADKVVGKSMYTKNGTDKVDAFMKSHPDMTIQELLALTDYSFFK